MAGAGCPIVDRAPRPAPTRQSGSRPTTSRGGKPRSTTIETVLKRFEDPDEVREFEKGRLDVVRLGGLTIGRATYEPGWRWSLHVGPATGATRCTVEHVGMVIAGTATAAFDDGRVVELRAGELFHVPAEPHDSWVVGDEEYVSLHFLGADTYAAAPAAGKAPD